MSVFAYATRKNRVQVRVAALVLLAVALVIPQFTWADHASDHPDSQLNKASSMSPSEAYAAESARWVAQGTYYMEKSERAAAADSARWVAQGNYYKSERAAAADSARWAAQGTYYMEKFERAAAADSARWAAQGTYYMEKSERAAAADSARWVAQGNYYKSERAAAADSARWVALGSHYTAGNAVFLAENPEVMTYRRSVQDGCSELGQVC